jgi:hypothetical protein
MTMTIEHIAPSTSPSPLDAGSPTDSAGTPPAAGVDSCGALLPAPLPLMDGDIGAEIALLNIRAGRDADRINTVTEQTEDELQDVAEQNEVNEMHQEASDIMSDAVAAGLMQVAQGGMQTMGGVATSDLPAAEGQSAQMRWQGGATLYGAGATLFTAKGQADQQTGQALVTSYKAIADRAQQLSTEATQGEQAAQSVIANAIQFFQQYVETKGQIDLVAAGQRA